MDLGFDPSAPKRPVNLNADLVARCKSVVCDFSADVEALVVADLAKREASAAGKRRTARAIDAFSAPYADTTARQS